MFYRCQPPDAVPVQCQSGGPSVRIVYGEQVQQGTLQWSRRTQECGRGRPSDGSGDRSTQCPVIQPPPRSWMIQSNYRVPGSMSNVNYYKATDKKT